MGAGRRTGAEFSKYAEKLHGERIWRGTTCLRQWEPSADCHFTGNERSKNKKRLLCKIVTYIFRGLYDKV